jgi:hypothetical protein
VVPYPSILKQPVNITCEESADTQVETMAMKDNFQILNARN